MLKKKFPSLASIGSDGNTAFLRAARAGHLDKVLEQLKNNVDINTSNANGLNALHLASKDGHINVVSELLKRGAKVDSATKKGNTALHIASLAGQEEVVRHLVEHGACVNVQSQNGFTPLYMAAQENHDAVVRFLLANGANQSLATEDGFTPLAVAMQQGHDKVVAVLLENDTRGKVRLPALHIAAKKDDCKAAALLLQNEHNPDVTSKSGFTPLHIASHYGNEAIANLLLSKGADVNYAAKHNITPLHVAAKWGKANMVSVLLSRGANIEAKTRDGLTPLHCAARSGHEQVVDMLLERGAPISAKTKNGLAALHMSSQGDHVDAARILLYHRAPVDDVTVDYLTALHVAAHCGHVGVARLLLDRKADPNARALNGFTPLHIACKKNRIKVVELLLKHGASIEATTESGLTPLHVASFMGCMNIVIYLVQNEAGPDVKTVRGETPLHLAARANQTDIIRILLRNGAQVDARAREQQTPLHIASRLGNVDIVMLLLQHGASVDSTTKDLYTALHIAAKEGQDEVASVLLENGASLEATTKKGFTPLHLAAKYGHMNVAKLLLRRDAPVDAQGKNGVTPLHVASHYDHQNVALLLLEKGASPHATAKNGHTPLHIAARKNQMDIATTLLEYGAKANAESKAGFTPLHLSAQEGHCDMSNLLIEHQADVNHKAKNGLTPLHLCSQEDRVEVGGILLKNESDVNSTTKAGYTPLHVACHFGQMGMVRLLLANGASVKPTTAVNYTPLHQAAQQGHSVIVNELLAAGADPNATTNQGQTAMSIAQKLGYISVMETLKGVTDAPISPTSADEKYKVVSPETMQETFMSDSEDEGGEDTMLSEQPYHYLTVDEMKGLGDDSLPIDVTRDERDNRDMDDTISPQHMKESYTAFAATDNVDINRHPLHVGFLVSFLVDARGGAMRGVRHSGVRVIVPPRRASMPLRVTCRYLKRDKLPHPPPLMEGEALASRILELGPVGAKFLGPVMIEVPHFGSLRGKEREIVILRSDNGETWREHTFEASEEAVHDVLSSSFEKDELSQYEESPRMTRILTTEFPHYIAVVSRVRQEVHAIGPEGGMVSSTVVPQVQAVFPHGALTKKIKVGLQAQPIPADLTAKLLGNRVAVSPIVTVEPRRRKFHKPISLTIPVPQAANKGMINQYSGDAPTLRLLCSITGGTTRAQWEDVTGSTPLTFVNDCVSFTTTVSARFWLMDCRNITEATKMATELYREAIHVPFMAKFVVFAKRVDTTEARLRVFCMTDDKEDKTLEHQEHFTEVAKSRDVEVLEGKTQYLEFAGNLVPVTKSGEQLQLGFRAFKENRLPFTVRVKDPHADAIGRTIFMREPKVAKGDVPQQPICILNIVLPEEIIPEPDLPEHEAHKHSYITHTSGLQRLSDVSNLLGEDWVSLAGELGVSTSEVNSIKTELCESSVAHQGLAMLRLWLQNAGNKASASALEQGLRNIGRDDIVQQTVFQTGTYALSEELSPSYTTKQGVFKRIPGEKREIIEERRIEERIPKDEGRDVSIEERTPEIEERIPKKEERRMTIDKDDGDEKKYVAEEKAVEEESLKSVSERKKEIEKRLSQDVEDISTKLITKETKVVTKETKTSKETVVTKVTSSVKETSSKDVKTDKSKKLLDDTKEKETAEEKAVSPEPAHLSFDEKRKSFELGITPKEKVKQQDSLTGAEKPQQAVTAAFIAEESRVSVQEVKKEAKTEEKEEEEEKELSFAEKRRSFEQGLTMKQPGDKMPAAERKKEAATDRKAEEEKRVADFRRDSELFQEVSQGLGNIEKGIIKPAAQELLSPGVARTPPPSPADFSKDAPDNKKWSVETASNLLSGEDKPRGADKSKEAVNSSWLSRQDQVTEDAKKTPTQDKTLKEPLDQGSKDKGKRNVKKESAKKNENPSLFRKESFKRLTPDKTPEPSKKVLPDKTAEPSNKLSPDITPEPSKRVSKDKKLQPSKKASPDKTSDPSKKVSPDKTTELSKKVSTDKAPDLYKKISPDKASAPSKRTSPDKKLEPPKKVSPEKSTEPLKKESPDKTPEPSKKVPPVKADKKLFERGDSKKSSSPEKSILASQENVAVAKAKSSAESSSVSTEKVMSKSHSKSAEKEGGIEVDSSKTISTETTKKESTKSETTVKENVKTKEDLTKVEEKITEQAAKPAKGAGNEKKSTILGKTIETIKKPFQDKSAVKEEKGNAKGKGKRNSADSIKTPSLEIGEDGEDRSKSELDSKGQVTKGSTKEIISVTSQVIQEPVVGKTVVEKSVEIVRQVSGERGGQSGKGKGKGKGKGSELLKALSKTKSEEQGKSIIDLKGEKAKTDSVTNEDEGMPKEHKGKGKGKEKPESPKGDSLDKGDAKGKTAPTSTQADKSSESKNEDEGVDQNDQGKLQSADRVSVVEPLIEKTIQDSRVISVGSVTEDKVKKDDTGSPTSDKNKGKGKDKGKERQRSAGTPSLAESDKPQKSDTNVVGKAVEIIKKPFQSQAKPSEDTKAAQKPGKGKKQKSIESQKIPSFDKDDIANEQVELASLSERDENDEQETLHPENDDTKVEKPLLKDNKTNGKGKGKQKSTESTKTPSFDKDKAVQNEPKLETVLKEQNEESKHSEQTKRESKKKSKGNQQSTDVPNTQSLEEEDGTLKQVSTQETTLIDGTLENIKRPFRGQKDEKSESKEGQEVEGKKGKGKAKQKSTELVRQSSTEEPKEGRIRTTETVRLIKELSEDKNGQVIEERAIDLVTKPFGDKPPLLKSTLSTEESTRPAILIKELSQDKSGQEIEDKAIELVSKPLEQRDSNKVLSGGLVTTTTITLSNEKSQKQCGQIMEELQDLACQPLQEVSSSQKQAVIASENSVELVNETLEQRDGKLPAGKIVTATVISLTRNVSPVATGFAEKELDIVSRPLQDMLDPHTFLRKIVEAETPITGPPIQELSHEKSKFIIEERPIDLVSQPFQGILESVHQPSLTRQLHDGGHIVEKSTGEGESSATGPLIKELSHEKSGFIIEERPIDLVSQPFQDILESVHQPSLTRQLHDGGHVVEKSTGEGESSVTGPLIKELSHEKSGFIIEERPIDLVSQPFQGILETLKSTKLHPSDEEGTKSAVIVLEERYDDIGRSFEETRELPPSSVEGTTRAVSLMKELSQDQSGQVIQEGAIDLVAQPFLGSMGRKDDGSKMKKKESKLKTGDSKKKDGSTTRTDDFEHIQKTIDDARIQFEQFVGIVSEKATKSSSDKTDESESSSKITKTSQIMKPGVIEGGEIHPTEEQEVEIPVDKEEDLLRFQNTIQCSFQDIPTGKIITTDEKTAKTTKKIIQGAENVQSQAEDVFDADDRDMEKFRETVWHAFQDIPSGKIETAEVKTVTKTITEPVEQGTEYVSSQAGKAVSTIDKDIKEATEMVQHGFQDTPSGEVGSIDIKTVTTTVAKPSEQGVGNVHSQAEKIRGVIDKDLSSSKICTTDIKTLTITIAEPIEPGIEIARSQADKVIGVIDKDTKKVSIHHGFQDTPSGKIGTDMKTVTTTISKPTEQGAENGCGQAGKVVGAVDEDIKEVTNTVQHEFQDIPCEEYGTINVETVSTTITVPTEQEAKNVQIQMEKVIGAVDKDTKKFVESVQHEFQDILSSEKTGTIGLKTVTSISKPVEQGAEKFVGAVDKDIKKVAERVSKSLDGGVTVIEKSIESQVKSVKDIPVTCIEKSCGSVREHLPKLDDSFLSFGKKKAKETDLSRVEEIVHQQQNLPSEKGGTINVTTLTETVTKPIEQRVENLSVRAEKVAGDIEEVVRENMKRNVDGEDTTILETNESRAKTMKDAPETFMKKSGLTVTEALDGGFKGLGEMAHETMETFGLSQSSPKIDTKDMEQNDESLGQEVYGKDIFPPELRAQSVKIATFETVETIPPPGTEKDGTTVLIGSSCNDEIGRIIKEMESQLLSTKFGLDEYTVEDGSEIESEDYTRESRTMPTTPLPARKVFSDTEAILDSEGDSKPYVTTPTLSRRVIGVGGSQRLTQDERPVVRVITEYVGDLSENEPEEDTYTVLEPEVRERRKFKIRFSPDMYGSENKEDDGVVPGSYYDETAHATIEDLKRSDSIKSEKNNKRIERKFERMTSQTKEADPSMSEVTDGEFQRMVSQLSLEEMDQALHQWDVGGLTPSEIDSKDLTLSSDDTTSPLQQGLTDIFRPKLSSILPTSIYVEKTGTEVGASGVTESSKMKLSLVKDSVPQIFQSVETDGQVRGESIKTEQEQKQTVETHRRERDEETQEGAYGFSENKTKGAKK